MNIINDGYAIGSTMELVCDTRAIGGVQVSHICFGKILRYTKTQIVCINEHGNEMRFYLKTGYLVGGGYDTLTPRYFVKC